MSGTARGHEICTAPETELGTTQAPELDTEVGTAPENESGTAQVQETLSLETELGTAQDTEEQNKGGTTPETECGTAHEDRTGNKESRVGERDYSAPDTELGTAEVNEEQTECDKAPETERDNKKAEKLAIETTETSRKVQADCGTAHGDIIINNGCGQTQSNINNKIIITKNIKNNNNFERVAKKVEQENNPITFDYRNTEPKFLEGRTDKMDGGGGGKQGGQPKKSKYDLYEIT